MLAPKQPSPWKPELGPVGIYPGCETATLGRLGSGKPAAQRTSYGKYIESHSSSPGELFASHMPSAASTARSLLYQSMFD